MGKIYIFFHRVERRFRTSNSWNRGEGRDEDEEKEEVVLRCTLYLLVN